MTTFDRAWNIAKMPIVPGSVRRNYRDMYLRESDYLKRYPNPTRFIAEFDDPITQERLTMNAAMNTDDKLHVDIKDQKDDTYNYHPRATAYFRELDMDNEPEGTPRKFRSMGVNTDDEYQRRGYASALYDLASYILDRRDGGNRAVLVPSSDQTMDGKRFWQSIYEDMEDDEEPRWRLRGDL